MASAMRDIDSEEVVWGAAGFAASVLVGVLIEPFRRSIGLENVIIVYLVIVVLAAAPCRTTSSDHAYRTLGIDSLSQVVTVTGSASRGRACACRVAAAAVLRC
jgi:hypothetical protein